MERAPTKVAIVGAGKGGIALLELLHQIPEVDIIGIADKDPQAPGLQRARDLSIHVTDKIPDLIGNHGVTVIVDVTGDPRMRETILSHKPPDTEVLNGATAKLLWNLIQRESQLEAELFHAEKLAGLGSFAAGIAHDINNPLQLILGLAENIVQEKDLNAVREQAREIIEAVKRTSAICRDLTRYARRHAGHDDASVNLNQKLDEALKIARYAVTLQDIAIVKQYAPKAIVKGNPDELLHVFVNLITNAVQAMAERGTLTLKTEEHHGTVTVTVTDTGCGIPKDLLPRIFDPLFTTKPAGKGTGLGLYNVMSVVSKMHGHIAVDSTVGKGSSFRIEFSPASQPIDYTTP
jgi:signal transduction histidine kinase